MKDLLQKRCNLIIDYISQILVYASNTKGVISFDKKKFDDGDYLILMVSVIKNNYFRWHDLGITVKDSIEFYNIVIDSILCKFKNFTISFDNNIIYILSSLNHNQINIEFNLNTKKEKEFFQKQVDLFYNKNK